MKKSFALFKKPVIFAYTKRQKDMKKIADLIDTKVVDKKPKLAKGYIIYEGASVLSPSTDIVAILTVKSSNVKTGNMAQLWILNKDLSPIETYRQALDYSICGDCPQRRSMGGGCYVNIGQAPEKTYESYRVGKYPSLELENFDILQDLSIRFGAYGDPAAIPLEYTMVLKAVSSNNTAYTHQWKNPEQDMLKYISMASVDSPAEIAEAKQKGWRYFRVANENGVLYENEILCPNITHNVQCKDCGLCDGVKGSNDLRKDIVVVAHGSVKKRFKV